MRILVVFYMDFGLNMLNDWICIGGGILVLRDMISLNE